MNSLTEIEEAIESLPPEQFESLARWIAERREDAADREFEADVKAGALDAAWKNAVKEIEAGEVEPLDEICNYPDVSRGIRETP